MTISDRDRKILWARSGNLCAICKVSLVADRTEDDPESVVGDEAHIAARSPGGPRYGECDPSAVDTYANLILLCKIHHKVVDDQVHHYSAPKLRQLKAAHEAWVKDTLHGSPAPIRLQRDPSAGELALLKLVRTGGDLWQLVSRARSYILVDLDATAPDASDDELAQTAEFFQLAGDWVNISDDVVDNGTLAVRDAKRSLAEALDEVMQRELLVFGGEHKRIITGGVLAPAQWTEIVLQVVRADNEHIVRSAEEPPS